MSRTETYRGKLTPVDLQGGELDSWIQELLQTTALPNYCESWIEALEEERYGEYLYEPSSGILYEVQREELDPSGFIHSVRNADGSYSFLVSYYNGGASFGEVALSALRSAPTAL